MISADNLASYQDAFAASPINRLMQNAVTESPITKVAMDRSIAVGIDKTVSHRLDDWKVTNQKKSGRCWLFSGLNSLRYAAAKQDILSNIYRVLAIHLGTPPTDFEWEWQDKDKNFTRAGRMTPLEFAEKYITVELDDYVCVVNDPRPTSEYGKTYTVDRLGNVVGGTPVTYLNAPIDVLKTAVKETIVDGDPVWFGCDTNKQSSRDLGIWDAHLYDYEGAYSLDLTLDKANRLIYGDSLMTHAMVFVGVDVDDDGNARRFRVENSWGEDIADKGFFTMNSTWFDEYVFEIAIHKDRLPADLRAVVDAHEEPIVLPAWDPMGALA